MWESKEVNIHTRWTASCSLDCVSMSGWQRLASFSCPLWFVSPTRYTWHDTNSWHKQLPLTLYFGIFTSFLQCTYLLCNIVLWKLFFFCSPLCLRIFTTRAAQRSEGVLLSVLSVCVRMFVIQHNNSWTVRDTIMKFLEHHAMVKTEAKFENGCIEVGSCWFNFSFSDRHNPTSPSRSQWTRP